MCLFVLINIMLGLENGRPMTAFCGGLVQATGENRENLSSPAKGNSKAFFLDTNRGKIFFPIHGWGPHHVLSAARTSIYWPTGSRLGGSTALAAFLRLNCFSTKDFMGMTVLNAK